MKLEKWILNSTDSNNHGSHQTSAFYSNVKNPVRIKTTAQLKKKGLDLLLYKIWSQLRDRLGHLPPQDSEPIYSAMSIHVVFCSLLFKT